MVYAHVGEERQQVAMCLECRSLHCLSEKHVMGRVLSTSVGGFEHVLAEFLAFMAVLAEFLAFL
jgi:hypothetical protein